MTVTNTDPLEINILDLPYGSILCPESLPDVPCVYLCLSRNRYPVYIGQSQGLKWRWMSSHHRKQDCKRLGATKIAWILDECETLNNRKQIEKLFIKRYNPKLNIEIWAGFRHRPFFGEIVLPFMQNDEDRFPLKVLKLADKIQAPI